MLPWAACCPATPLLLGFHLLPPRFLQRSGPVAPESWEGLGSRVVPSSQPRGPRGQPELWWAVLEPGWGTGRCHCRALDTLWPLQEGWQLDYRKDRLGRGRGEAPESDPPWRGVSWAENRMTPSQGFAPGKPGVGLRRGVQQKPRGGCPVRWPRRLLILAWPLLSLRPRLQCLPTRLPRAPGT